MLWGPAVLEGRGFPGWGTHRGTETPEHGVPTGKTGAGRPRVPKGEQSLERGSPRKGQG